MSESFYNFNKIHEITSKSRVTIWRWMQNGNFPKSHKIGENSVAWLKSEVDAWVESKTMEASDA